MHTKLSQFEILVQFMEDHPQLAKGQMKALNAKTAANNLWKRLAENLNNEGPPVREVVGWKKVSKNYCCVCALPNFKYFTTYRFGRTTKII